MKTVVVGLSGGVDSSIAAFLLKEKGYQVIGLFMKNWHDESVTISNDCPWLDDSNDAMLVAEKLNIPFQTVDLSTEYKSRIVDYMFNEYKLGRTPNPDILCNREIKFDVFLKIAFSLGADYVATGHYCRKNISNSNKKTPIYSLRAGVDKNNETISKECIQMVRDKIGPVAAFKVAIVIKRLPKTRSGKILRGTIRKIADNVEYKTPPTIDDPAILDEIKQDLVDNKIIRND